MRTAGGVLAHGRDPYFAPWPDVVQLNAFAPGPARRGGRDADRHRRPVRRAALRHGDADDQRGLRAHVGRARRPGAGGRVLADAHRARQGGAPGLAVHRRGVLGHGVDAPATGLRPLLRQAPLRPAGARARRVGARAPPGRRRPTRSGCSASSRTTTSRARPRPSGPRRRARRPSRCRRCRARGSTTTASSRAGERASRCSSAAARRAAGRRPAGVLRAGCCAAVADADLREATGACAHATGWPDNDSHRRLVAWCWASARLRHLVVVNLSDAPAQARVRLPWDDLAGRGWELPIGSTASASSATATSSPPTACTSRSTPGPRTSSRWSATTDRPGIWGPYLSERQWGTVREDYSQGGDAWNYFSHDQARSRAYRWGEDGIAGICDDRQRLCFALALWNGADPILKERMFGLTNSEGNHGEDVKEYWFYLDSTPTHSYLKYLYKYPQRAFPYADLVATNRARGKQDMEYELLDTGIFERTATSTSSWSTPRARPTTSSCWSRRKPRAGGGDAAPPADALVPQHVVVGRRRRRSPSSRPTAAARRAPPTPSWVSGGCSPTPAELLFCENETNNERLFGAPTPAPRQGRDQRPRRRRRARGGEPRADRHQGGRAPRAGDPRLGETASVRLRLTGAASCDAARRRLRRRL